MAATALATWMTVLEVRSWMKRHTEMSWPRVTATVTSLEQRPGFRGRSFTYLRGEYRIAGVQHHFSVVWAASEAGDRGWVPPEGTPPVGSKLVVHADARNPSSVALEEAPLRSASGGKSLRFALVLLALIGWAIAVWFI